MSRFARGGAAVLLALGWAVGGPGAAPAAAATPDLTLVTTARYDVQPARHRVHVTVSITATNHHADTVIRRFWFDRANLAVLPGTTRFQVRAVGSSAHPTVSIVSRTPGQTLLRIGFGRKLYSGKSLGVRLTFDLPDPGGSPDRDVRVGDAIATFPVWAFGSTDTPGSSAAVVMPAGFHVEVLRGPLSGPTPGANGAQVYSSGRLARPLGFFAYVLADRPGAYATTALDLAVAGQRLPVAVRAWRDDAAFGKRTSAILKAALPELGNRIGMPVPLDLTTGGGTPGASPLPYASAAPAASAFPGASPAASGASPDASPGASLGASPLASGAPVVPTVLTVQEAVTRASGGYAALFDPAAARIEVAYDASPFVVLHESAHAWFNGRLVADRWAAEGFASYYAALVAPKLKIAVPAGALTKPLLAARVPLNAWQADGRDARATDAYAFTASRVLAGLIARRAGADGLTAVWKAAAADEAPDQPVHAVGSPELMSEASGASAAGPTAPDWRTLLDLLETRTSASYTDLWREWVVRPEERTMLDDRAAARAAYAAAVAEAGDWELPRDIRTALDRWQFDDATALTSRARALLVARPGLESKAASAGLSLPSTLRTAFERDGPVAAEPELAAETAAIDRIAADADAEPANPGIVARIGLLGEHPEIRLAESRTAFAVGDLSGAVAAADAARLTWLSATDAGRGRLAGVAIVLALIGIALLAMSRRGRRAQRAPRSGPGSGRLPMARAVRAREQDRDGPDRS